MSVPPLHLFLVLPTRSELCPRACILESRPWVISDQEIPFAESSIEPRAKLRKEPGRSSRDLLWTTGSGRRQASSLGSRSPCLGHSVLPRPCEYGRHSMVFFLSRLFFQFKHTDGLYGSQYRRLFSWYNYIGQKDWGFFFY